MLCDELFEQVTYFCMYAEIPEQNVLAFLSTAISQSPFSKRGLKDVLYNSGHLVALMAGCRLEIFCRPCFQTFITVSFLCLQPPAFSFISYVLSPL
jgi:hypothetical protein